MCGLECSGQADSSDTPSMGKNVCSLELEVSVCFFFWGGPFSFFWGEHAKRNMRNMRKWFSVCHAFAMFFLHHNEPRFVKTHE